MPNKSKKREATKKNRALGSGRRSAAILSPILMHNHNTNLDLTVCHICTNLATNDCIFNRFNNRNIEYSEYNVVSFEDEDDEIIIENNDFDYEMDISEKFNSLMLDVNINNELIFSLDGIKNCGTKNFGIRQGFGSSRSTEFKKKKKKN